MAWIYDPVWLGSVGLGMAWYGKVLLEKLRCGLVRYGALGLGRVWFGGVFPI